MGLVWKYLAIGFGFKDHLQAYILPYDDIRITVQKNLYGSNNQSDDSYNTIFFLDRKVTLNITS